MDPIIQEAQKWFKNKNTIVMHLSPNPDDCATEHLWLKLEKPYNSHKTLVKTTPWHKVVHNIENIYIHVYIINTNLWENTTWKCRDNIPLITNAQRLSFLLLLGLWVSRNSSRPVLSCQPSWPFTPLCPTPVSKSQLHRRIPPPILLIFLKRVQRYNTRCQHSHPWLTRLNTPEGAFATKISIEVF